MTRPACASAALQRRPPFYIITFFVPRGLRRISWRVSRINAPHVLRSVVATTSITDGDDPGVLIVPTRHIVERGRWHTTDSHVSLQSAAAKTNPAEFRGYPRPSLSKVTPARWFRKRITWWTFRNLQAIETQQLFGLLEASVFSFTSLFDSQPVKVFF